MERTRPNGAKTLRTAIAFLVHSNLFISTASTGVALSTTLLAGFAPEPLPLGIVFVATLFVYSLNRLTDIEEDSRNVPERAAFTERYGRPLLAVGAALYLAAILAAIEAGVRGAPLLLSPVAVAFLYSLVGVKRILLMKNLLVGLSWGAIPLGVGVYYGAVSAPEIVVSFGFFTVMLTVAAAVFDIKDIRGDRAEGIRTAPVVFGPRATRIGALAVTVAVGGGLLGVVGVGIVPRRFLLLFGFLAYVAAYVPFATTDRGPLFYGFVIDGEHVFLALAVLGLRAAGIL